MVRSHGIDLLDQRRVRHRDIGDPLLHLSVGRHAYQEQELPVRGMQPKHGYQNRQDDRTHRIDPPHQFRPTHRRHQPESVDEEVIAVILPQDAHLAVHVPQREAVSEKKQLCDTGDSYSDNGRDVKLLRVHFRRRSQLK